MGCTSSHEDKEYFEPFSTHKSLNDPNKRQFWKKSKPKQPTTANVIKMNNGTEIKSAGKHDYYFECTDFVDGRKASCMSNMTEYSIVTHSTIYDDPDSGMVGSDFVEGMSRKNSRKGSACSSRGSFSSRHSFHRKSSTKSSYSQKKNAELGFVLIDEIDEDTRRHSSDGKPQGLSQAAATFVTQNDHSFGTKETFVEPNDYFSMSSESLSSETKELLEKDSDSNIVMNIDRHDMNGNAMLVLQDDIQSSNEEYTHNLNNTCDYHGDVNSNHDKQNSNDGNNCCCQEHVTIFMDNVNKRNTVDFLLTRAQSCKVHRELGGIGSKTWLPPKIISVSESKLFP